MAALELVNQPDESQYTQDDEASTSVDSMPALSGVPDPQNMHNGNTANYIHYRPAVSQDSYSSNTPFLTDGMQMRPGGNPWFDQSGMTLPTQMDLDPFQGYANDMLFNFDPFLESDTSALTGLESVFNITPGLISPQQNNVFLDHPSPPVSLQSASVGETLQSPTNLDFLDLTRSPEIKERFGGNETINPDREYLRSQGCFQLPSVPAFYGLMRVYFSFIHPNLPIVNEADFWTLWSPDGDAFHVGQFSILVLQAMSFAAISVRQSVILSELRLTNIPSLRHPTFLRSAASVAHATQ